MKGCVVDGYFGRFFSFCKRVGRGKFPGGQFNETFDSKRRSRLRQTISLRIPLACLQSHCLHTSCEIKRLLFSGCEAIIFLMVATSFLLTDRLRYVTIASIPDNINHRNLERKLFLKETYRTVLNLKFRAIFCP